RTDLRPVLRRGPVRELPAAGRGRGATRAGACARTPAHDGRRPRAAAAGADRLAGQGQAADRAAPALGGAVAAARRTLRAPRRAATATARPAARHAGAGGARRAVPSRLDRSGRSAAPGRRAAGLAAGAAHPDAGPGRLPRLLLLLPGTDPADGGGVPRPRPGARLGPS